MSASTYLPTHLLYQAGGHGKRSGRERPWDGRCGGIKGQIKVVFRPMESVRAAGGGGDSSIKIWLFLRNACTICTYYQCIYTYILYRGTQWTRFSFNSMKWRFNVIYGSHLHPLPPVQHFVDTREGGVRIGHSVFFPEHSQCIGLDDVLPYSGVACHCSLRHAERNLNR